MSERVKEERVKASGILNGLCSRFQCNRIDFIETSGMASTHQKLFLCQGYSLMKQLHRIEMDLNMRIALSAWRCIISQHSWEKSRAFV
jgi:hypothetical protein